MKKVHEIIIEERLRKVIKIKAIDLKEALEIVESRYNNENIILDSSDFFDVKIFKENLK